MARWLLPVLPALLADGAMAFPTPPEQTAEQISNFARIRAAAKVASEAATPQVLAYFDSAPFRSMLKDCCPKVAGLPAEELLRRYRAEAQVSELAHALPAQMKDIFSDVTVKEVGEMAWFPNEFQVALIHHRNTSAGASPVNDLAQKDVFGCKPFAGPEPTWSEVANRLIYIAHNMRRLDSGSEPFFGDFTVIFNSTHVKDSVVIAPYDTGLFVMGCFHPDLPLPGHLNRSMLPPLNCSAWTRGAPPPGTLEYLDHLILPNLAASTNTTVTNRTMLDSARALFSRSAMSEIDYQDVPALGMETLGDYLESDILANPRLPEAVKFGIGSFPTLFGTEDGQDLRQIAKRLKWPLFWSFGTGNPTVEDPHMSVGLRFKSNLRIADPGNIALTTNASVSNTAAETFQRVWQEAAAVRSKRNATKDDVHQWWGALSDQLRVAPISATSCHSVHDCVAVDLSGECICVGQQKVEQLAFTV